MGNYISTAKRGDTVYVWERDSDGKRVTVQYDAPYYFYVKTPDGEFTSLYGDKLTRFDFTDSMEFYAAKKQCEESGYELFESDISPELKVLSNKYYGKKDPKLNVSFYDIEVDYSTKIGFASPSNPYAVINAVAIFHQHQNRLVVIAIPPKNANCEVPKLGKAGDDYIKKMNDIAPLISDITVDIQFVSSEKNLLEMFLDEIDDSDVICGWNNSGFDDPYVAKRLEEIGPRYLRKFCFPDAPPPKWRTVEIYGKEQPVIDLMGRVSLDYLTLFKKYMVENQQSYALANIADKFLRTDGIPDMPKLEYSGSLAGLYRDDFDYFIRYNIRDTEILHGFEEKFKYVSLANTMVHISTGQFSQVAGTIKLTELAVINYCHHELGNVIVNDSVDIEDDTTIKGALVLDPVVGMHEWVSSVDLNSLYPAAIRSCNISPETKRGQFLLKEAAFEMIRDDTEDMLDFQTIDNEFERKSARDWKKYLIKKGWCISGFGTVFTMEKQGVIPRILEDWYTTRKVYQAKQIEAKDAAKELLENKIDTNGTMVRKDIPLTESDAEAYDKLIEDSEYFDRLQYVYKIKLNSSYGAICQKHFKFSDKSLGESTTAIGRHVVVHQHSKVNEALTGEYDAYGEAIVYGDSVAGDTIIETNEGPIKIEDLFTHVDSIENGKEYCNRGDIESLTFNELPQINQYRKIKYVVRHAVNKQMYRVWFGNTRYVDVSEDHSFIGVSDSRSKTPCQLVNVRPTDIGKGHINSVLLNANNIHTPVTITNYPKELYILMGLILGDGYVDEKSNGCTNLSVGSSDKKEIVDTVLNPLIGAGWITSVKDRVNKHDIRIHGAKLKKFLLDHLYTARTKKIPDFIFLDSKENIGLFLNGYFTANGTVINGSPRLSSVSAEYIKGSNILLKNCGIASNYWTETTENSYAGVPSGTYSTILNVYDSVRFEQLVGFSLVRKHQKIRVDYGKRKIHLMGQNGYTLIVPTLIEKIDSPDYIYDIEVMGTHKFYGNDILLHNTDSTYFHTFCDNTDDARAVGDAVAKSVNKSFHKFMRDNFLLNDEYNGIMKCGREIVSKRGIFVKKKKYMLHLVDLDGYAVDKLKVMGLDTKRTTIPKHISSALEKFLERLLKGEQWDSIEQDIVDYKESLLSSNLLDIGIPSGINNLEKYTSAFSDDPKTFIPGHVSAAVLYNICRKDNNDNQSVEITSGMKIKRFILKRPYGRFKAIALPTDTTEQEIPEWFSEFEIDINMHMEKLIDAPLNNVIKAIGELAPTKKSMMIKSIFDF